MLNTVTLYNWVKFTLVLCSSMLFMVNHPFKTVTINTEEYLVLSGMLMLMCWIKACKHLPQLHSIGLDQLHSGFVQP